MRVPVPSSYVFTHGVLCLSVEAAVDFDKPVGHPDRQARDLETGVRVWTVNGLDLDPEAARFGRQNIKVKVIADVRPVPPAATVPGYPPVVEFVDLIVTPWVDDSKCTKESRGVRHKCPAKLSFALRASGMVAGHATVPMPDMAGV
jgi:hypothetical protein